MKRLVVEGNDYCNWVGDWNDDEVTQEPHSRTCGFSLLAISCQGTEEKCKLYSKPIRVCRVVCMCACMCGDLFREREYKELTHKTKQVLAKIVSIQ